jgi:Aspartyl protease/PDZ domain
VCIPLFLAHADDRFWGSAEVNGKPATFVFDTGAGECVLFDEGAKRLGLTNLPVVETTEECDLALGSNHCRMWFTIFHMEQGVNAGFDGLLGWPLWRNNILQLDAESGRITPLAAVPAETASWTKISVFKEASTLDWMMNGPKGAIEVPIDTGATDGVVLPSGAWRAWRKQHRDAPSSLELYASFWDGLNAGFATTEKVWAESFDIGPIHLTGVPIGNAGPMSGLASTRAYAGTLEIDALKRLDIIIDGPRFTAWVRPKTTPPQPVNHNRSGAIIDPREYRKKKLILRVLDGGPAFEAGLRDGDALVEFDGHEVHRMGDINPGGSPSPPGQKVAVKSSLRRLFAAISSARRMMPCLRLRASRTTSYNAPFH